MARLVEDSDDEFPELAVVIGKCEKGSELKVTGADPMNTLKKKTAPNQTVMIATVGFQSMGYCASSESFKGSAVDAENRKSRKQVRKEICDNPLPRTFDKLKESTPATELSKRFELQSIVLPTRPRAHAESKAADHSSMSSAAADEEISWEDSTGMSDFIISDSSSLEGDSADEGVQSHPPRSTRRLVRGRRSPGPDSSPRGRSRENVAAVLLNRRPSRGDDNGNGTPHMPKDESTVGILGNRCVVTPPLNPQKPQKRLLSPTKGPRIPRTPHRPSTDAFWDPHVVNEWNEEYSPRKSAKPHCHISDKELEIDFLTSASKKVLPSRDPRRREAKRDFDSKKHDIAEAFLQELDKNITDGKVFEMAALTGGIKIIWSKRLNTTAGQANWKRETMRSTTKGKDGTPETNITYRHYASIELAEKIINDEERLLNVIAHEFCHLANFMVSGIRHNPHGKEFKAWAAKCSRQFGSRGIHVTTKHSYDIDYKYIWECTNCGTEFKRHSKSIDPSRHQCGTCKSKLVQVKPVPRANAVANEYQLFVREHMRKVKEQNPGSPQKRIMEMVGKMYQEYKASKRRSAEEKLDSIDVGNRTDAGSRNESPEDNQIDSVMRKLNFLDLTSP